MPAPQEPVPADETAAAQDPADTTARPVPAPGPAIASLPEITVAEGIPLSAVNPLMPALETPSPFMAELERPWREEEERHREEMMKWRLESLAAIDRSVLDWPAASKGKDIDLGFAADGESARRAGLVNSYLYVFNDGREFLNQAERDFTREKAAIAHFGGIGQDDDSAFYGEMEKGTRFRKAAGELEKEFATEAVWSVVAAAAGEGAASYGSLLDAAPGKPGYIRGGDEHLHNAWTRAEEHVRAPLAGVAGDVRRAWQAMKRGEDLPVLDLQELTASREGREVALQALGMLAKRLPKEEQATILGNLRKQVGRDLKRQGKAHRDLIGSLFEGHDDELSDLPDSYQMMIDPLFTFEDARAAYWEDQEEAADFVADLQSFIEGSYDPVRPLLPEDSWGGHFERGLYSAPGAITSSATSMIPYYGQAWTVQLSYEENYQSIRQRLIAGDMDRGEARRRAKDLALPAALIQLPLDRVGLHALKGKLPFVSKAVDKVMDRLGAGITGRYLGRAAAGVLTETPTEMGQDLVPYALQELAHELDPAMPGVEFHNGKDGVFDGYGFKFAETLGAVLPLSLFMAGGSVFRDARLSALQEATDDQFLACGVVLEDLARLRAARSLTGFERVAGEVWTRRDPASDSARSAALRLRTEALAGRADVEQASREGLLPRVTGSREKGYTVYDSASGTVLGHAPDHEAATRLAAQHLRGLDERHAGLLPYFATMLESADQASAAATRPGDSTTYDIAPFGEMTPEQAELLAPGAESRHVAQTALRERMAGGDGQTLFSILGLSVTDMDGLKLDLRRTVNHLRGGATVLDVVHEKTHGFRREARARGRLTREDEVQVIRAYDAALADRSVRRGKEDDPQGKGRRPLSLLPPGIADAEITETMIDEAISEIIEVELLRESRRGTRRGRRGSGAAATQGPNARAIGVGSGVAMENLTAFLKLASPAAAQRFGSFMEAARTYFTLAFGRAAAVNRAQREGRFDQAGAEAFIAKLFGMDSAEGVAEGSGGNTRDLVDPAAADGGTFAGLAEGMSFSMRESTPERDARALPELEIPGAALEGGRADWRRAVREAIAAELQGKSILNKDTGSEIFFNSDSKRESVSKLRHEPAFRAAGQVRTIAEEAVLIGGVEAGKGRTDTLRFDYFALPVRIDGRRQTAWFNVRIPARGSQALFYEFGLFDRGRKERAPATLRLGTELPPSNTSQPGPAHSVGGFLAEIKDSLPAAVKVAGEAGPASDAGQSPDPTDRGDASQAGGAAFSLDPTGRDLRRGRQVC